MEANNDYIFCKNKDNFVKIKTIIEGPFYLKIKFN